MKTDEIKGDSLVLDARFNGVLDGQGHVVSNIYCDRFAEKGFPYSQCVGLVGLLGGSSDLNDRITGDFDGGWQPAVRNTEVGEGYIYGRRMVGGIVGRVGETNNGVIIENCANQAAIRNTDSKGIGGIVGAGWGKGSVRNCYNTGSVTTTYACPAGGICGSNNGLDIYNCYSVGKIDSNGQQRGRGIGGHDAGSYTVANCYYLEGSDDDPASKGWYGGSSTRITIDVTALTDAEMKSPAFADRLNASGEVFAPDAENGNGGYPVLYFQSASYDASASCSVTISQPAAGGTVSADATGEVAFGKIVNLTAQPAAGYILKYFTLNGERLDAPFFTAGRAGVVGAVFGKVMTVKAAIPSGNEYCLAVTRTGYKPAGGETVHVTDEAVSDGDALLEGNVVRVRALGAEGVSPEDMDYEYTEDFTFTATNADKNPDGSFTVKGSGDVSITVERGTRLKSWLRLVDLRPFAEPQSAYTITSAEELAGLAYLVNSEGRSFEGVTIRLGNDISLENTDGTIGVRTWKAIGANTAKPFKGTFDGGDHIIRDMTAHNDGSYAGLFGYCADATIRNVTVMGSVTGTADSSYAAGIVAYATNSLIENCTNRASVSASGSYAAGIAAHIGDASSVKNCVNRGAVKGSTGVGGIVGISYTGEDAIAACVNYGAIHAAGEGSYGTGGIVGRLAGTVDACANYGDISGADRYTGGVAGYATAKNASTVRNTLNAATVASDCAHGAAALGGLVGYGQYLTLEGSKNSGTVKKGAAFVSADFGETVGRPGSVAETPPTGASAFPSPVADKPPAETAVSKGPFTIRFAADDAILKTVTLAEGDGKPTPPAIPRKDGYTAFWDNYETGQKDITVRAVYRKITVRGGDRISRDGLYFLDFHASGVLRIDGGLTLTLDGSNGPCENLSLSVGGGAKLTLRDVNIGGTATALTTEGGTLRLAGENTLSSLSDAKDNRDPALLIAGDTELTGDGALTVRAGAGNSAIKVDDGKTFTLAGGTLTVIKTELLGEAGGALHAPGATVKISGGAFAGRTNSDNVAVIFAKNLAVSGGTLRLQAERSPRVIQAADFAFDGGVIYAEGHSGNSAAEDRFYYGKDAVSGLKGTPKGRFASEPPFPDALSLSRDATRIAYE
jgi:hypothetical protein